MSEPSLLRYLEIKTHHLIQNQDWQHIRVIGSYDRDCVISTNEKNDKLFNWQRPTAEAFGDELVVKCFPGADYVLHYALIIATYLNMVGRYRGQVSYELPAEGTCRAAVAALDLDIADDDLVVLGWGLGHFADAAVWNDGPGYAWQRRTVDGRRVLYLGYRHSIWGDVAGRVVSRLAELGARRVVYIGKLGSLEPHVAPNTCLASGTTSVLPNGRLVTWPDFFGSLIEGQSGVHIGIHATSPSILLEGQSWLAEQDGRHFVDPEIGHMGHAAAWAAIEFGFLHVISNNLACHYPADLSNERMGTVLEQRSILLDRIDEIIRLRLRTADHTTNSRSI